MVGSFAVHTALIFALLIFIKLLEAIFGIGIILYVVALVLLNVTLVLEGECAAWAPKESMENDRKTGLDRMLCYKASSVPLCRWGTWRGST